MAYAEFLTCEDSYVMVFVSVWTTGTSFVEISRLSPPAGTLLKLIVSVFTTGDCVNRKKKKKALEHLVKLRDYSEYILAWEKKGG